MTSISSRPASPTEDDFLYKVYASTRQDELAAWGWPPAEQERFLQMQYRARRHSYAAAYPDADERILLNGDVPVGTLIVARNSSELHLVDIAILPEYRGQGIGTRVLSTLTREADTARLPLRLSVRRENRALFLYTRLGFLPKGEDAMYIEMQYENQSA